MAGVAGGLAERHGIDVLVVRAAFVALALGGGAGIALYLLLWSLADADGEQTARPVTQQQSVAVLLVTGGVLLLLRDAGLWFGDSLVVPVLVAIGGSLVLWARGDADDRARWSALGERIPGRPLDGLGTGNGGRVRLVGGVLLVLIGTAGLVATSSSLSVLGEVLPAVASTVLGGVLVLGPWVSRLVAELGEERAERVRTEERADVAAHLHDSVLQTLALIQRSSDQPRRMAALARSQERELRAWLYGRRADPDADATLRDLLDASVAEVEAAHALEVDVVVVGDRPADDDVVALVAAVRETLVNVAKHAGTPAAAVYVEVEPDRTTTFVRDRGEGFDPATIADDRRGITDSVRGRLRRHGGTATLVTAPGEGTEWELTLPPHHEGAP